MIPRGIFVYWYVAMNEPERVLDDLARWTDINTVIVGVNYTKKTIRKRPRLWGGFSAPSM